MISFDNNAEFKLAWQLVENTGTNVFLTGNAGTGKTTFLKLLRERSAKNIAVVAPTGIAAINARGVTIHSFFQIAPGLLLPGVNNDRSNRHFERFSKEKLRLLKTLDLLVIDEISMVRADLLDAIDSSLRRHRNPYRPFGGIQLLIIGDLGQLSPVVKEDELPLLERYYDTPYFFSSKALSEAGYVMVELKHIYRQSDMAFISLLNKVRSGTVSKDIVEAINKRYIPGFNPDDKLGYIRLTTHNNRAKQINETKLAMLPGVTHTYHAIAKNDFPESSYPVEKDLCLKEGAQVMFLRNDPEHRYFNGLLGTVLHCGHDSVEVMPVNSETAIIVKPSTWQNTKFETEPESGQVREVIVGEFTQIPIRTAWAITIHKSQGLTFDHAIIDAAHSFVHGQTYVALSRCRSLNGLVLDSPLSESSFINDADIDSFTKSQRKAAVDKERLESLTRSYYYSMVGRLFDFQDIRRSFNTLHRLVDEFISRAYPSLAQQYATADQTLSGKLESVSVKFLNLIREIASRPESVEKQQLLDERIQSASKYFSEELKSFARLIKATPTDADNKAATKRLKTTFRELADLIYVLGCLLEYFSKHTFNIAEMLSVRARVVAGLDINTGRGKSAGLSKTTKGSANNIPIPNDVINPGLYSALVVWRNELCTKLGIPAYVILTNKALVSISNNRPANSMELLMVPGVGRNKVQRFGKDILKIVADN